MKFEDTLDIFTRCKVEFKSRYNQFQDCYKFNYISSYTRITLFTKYLNPIFYLVLKDKDVNVKLISYKKEQDVIERDTKLMDRLSTDIDDYKAPKNPIVLCHGLSGFDKLIFIPSVAKIVRIFNNSFRTNMNDNFLNPEFDDEISEKGLLEVEYWIGVKEYLQRKGCTVITAKVPAFGTIEERAIILNDFIERETGKLKAKKSKQQVYNYDNDFSKNESFKKEEKIKVNLIAHSMGGLDARYLISRIPNKNFDVISLTTVATPHHGSEIANYIIQLFDRHQRSIPVNNPNSKLLPMCFYQLTTYYMKYFNEITKDDPRVSYFSYGCMFQPQWYNVFYPTWRIINEATNGEPNDGMVTVKSSKWGHYGGTLQDMDHLDIINWKNRIQQDISGMFRSTKFPVGKPKIDTLNFYLRITSDLAERGF